jgi:membrane associated rhomboid family serine protease
MRYDILKQANNQGGKQLKGIIKAVDRFCYKHPRFGIPNLMICIVVGNVAVFLLSLMGSTGQTFSGLMMFNAGAILRGQVWRLITFVFIPQINEPFFLIISLYFYYFLGTTLERQWGTAKFTVYYITGMLFLVLFGFITYLFKADVSAGITVYFLNMSMFFAFATFYPDNRVLLFFVIPIKMKILALADLAFFAYIIIVNPFPIRLLPVVCLLHYFMFCGGWLIDYLRRSFSRSKRTDNTVNFRREAAKIKYKENVQTHLRKCEVCGKTDTDYPELEFRYCSRCNGYHCYCEEHINSHVHIR